MYRSIYASLKSVRLIPKMIRKSSYYVAYFLLLCEFSFLPGSFHWVGFWFRGPPTEAIFLHWLRFELGPQNSERVASVRAFAGFTASAYVLWLTGSTHSLSGLGPFFVWARPILCLGSAHSLSVGSAHSLSMGSARVISFLI